MNIIEHYSNTLTGMHMKRKLGAVVAVALLASGCSAPEFTEAEAMQACRDAVREQLKDPSSAEFTDEHLEAVGDYTFKGGGVVRSTNSFGAVVPTEYTCTVVESVSGDGEAAPALVRFAEQ